MDWITFFGMALEMLTEDVTINVVSVRFEIFDDRDRGLRGYSNGLYSSTVT